MIWLKSKEGITESIKVKCKRRKGKSFQNQNAFMHVTIFSETDHQRREDQFGVSQIVTRKFVKERTSTTNLVQLTEDKGCSSWLQSFEVD
ncbi:hypothetical protein K1719_010125 [Acacia pycnantha]|nr:hypothetical protein K1719_010125 [Acacia pycnantha]